MFKMAGRRSVAFNMYPNPFATPSNELEFRLNKINEIKDYFVAEIKERELMSKRLNKYIASFDYFGKSLIVLPVTAGSMFIGSFATVIGALVRMMNASFSLAFSITTEIVKNLLKTTRNKKEKHIKTVTLARSNLNSIESNISEALINNEISHGDFMIIINEERKYRELKESIRIMNKSKKLWWKNDLIKEGKERGINEVIKCNEIINNSLK